MYTIFIRDLIIEGIHGVTHKEKEQSQPFRINIQVQTNIPIPSHDHVDEVVDYRVIKKIAKRVVEEEQYELVETIGMRIATLIKEDPRIALVTISVEKAAIWDNGTPGVTITL